LSEKHTYYMRNSALRWTPASPFAVASAALHGLKLAVSSGGRENLAIFVDLPLVLFVQYLLCHGQEAKNQR
jgi:hypothetical protein